MPYEPLRGTKVLDLTRMIPGAMCTKKLADLGAEVVKVEQPGRGDYLRRIPPFFEGQNVTFLALNRNKRSIELDITTEDGLATFHALAEQADVVVEVSHPGRFKAMGIDFEAMRAARPELVVCSISGFGQDGPFAPLPSHGLNVDALSGLAPVVRGEDGRFRFEFQVRTTFAGEAAATSAALAITAALLDVHRGGEGAWIDASCWDAGAEFHRSGMMQQAAGVERFTDEEFNDNSLYAIYAAQDDRPVLFAALERKFWERFCAGVGREDLVDRWSGGAGGEVDFGSIELRDVLDEVFASAPAAEWQRRFVEWDVPGSMLLSGDDLLDHEHTDARGLVARGWHGSLPLVHDPIRWVEDGSRPGAGATFPPAIGEHTDEVLRSWLGEASAGGDVAAVAASSTP